MDYGDIEREKWIARRIASLFFFAFVVAASAVDSYVIQSGLSWYAKAGLAVLAAFIFFPLLNIIVELRLRKKHQENKQSNK